MTDLPREIDAPINHATLVRIAGQWLRSSRRCHVVLTERGTHEIPDAIGWGKTCILVECKASRADFLADLRKPHRNRPSSFGRERWYLVAGDYVRPEDLPSGWGLLRWTANGCRRIAHPTPFPESFESVEHERRLVLSELRIYQAQGITYKSGVDRWGVRAS